MKEGYEIALTAKPQRFLIAPRCCGLHVWPPFSSDTRPREIGNECLWYHRFPSKFVACEQSDMCEFGENFWRPMGRGKVTKREQGAKHF